MTEKICSHCKEPNPRAAIMCWACYHSFGEPKLPLWSRSTRPPSPLSLLGFVLLALGACLPVPRRNWLCWGGILAYALGVCMDFGRRPSLHTNTPYGGEAKIGPLDSILDTIFRYAIKVEASRISLLRKEKGIVVRYEVAGVWKEQLKIPPSIWPALEIQCRVRAGILKDAEDETSSSFTGSIPFGVKGRRYHFDLEIEPNEIVFVVRHMDTQLDLHS